MKVSRAEGANKNRNFWLFFTFWYGVKIKKIIVWLHTVDSLNFYLNLRPVAKGNLFVWNVVL